LLEIGAGAFSHCKSLVDITLPDTLTKLDDYSFNACTSLISINIPGNVEVIESWAFEWCTSLSSVTIEYGVRVIDSRAFRFCSSLKSIVIPGSVENIWHEAFDHTLLENIYFEGNAPVICDTWPFTNAAPLLTVHYRVGTTGWDSELWTFPRGIAIQSLNWREGGVPWINYVQFKQY
jgi:hypothetical protein